MARKLICGVGFRGNSVNSTDSKISNAEFPFYRKWKDMIYRCYSEKEKERNPCYEDCKVCEEWLNFDSFKSWMQSQDWQGNQLDKDILLAGNKIYSPEACCFVSGAVNKFLTDSKRSRGEFKIGCYYDKKLRAFRARCSNPFSNKLESLGLFECDTSAHLAWKKRKHELACQLADLQTDQRVAAALRVRYL